ncbi:MAG: divalent cation tolerance protein CutA [Nanoarchaeota archaeon]
MYVKLVIYVPKKDKDKMLEKLFSLGAGHFGNYDSYSFVNEGTTTFRALDTANPAKGKKNKITKVKEVKIETICKENEYQLIIKEIRKLHPYEEPAICAYKIEDLSL